MEGNRCTPRKGPDSAYLVEEVDSFLKFQYSSLEKPKLETVLKEEFSVLIKGLALP